MKRITKAEIEYIKNLPAYFGTYTNNDGEACAIGKAPMLLGTVQGLYCYNNKFGKHMFLPGIEVPLVTYSGICKINDYQPKDMLGWRNEEHEEHKKRNRIKQHHLAIDALVNLMIERNEIEVIDSGLSLTIEELKNEQEHKLALIAA